MRILSILLAALALVTTGTLKPTLAADAKLKVLLLTGDDVAPAHNWKEVADATQAILTASGKFDVTVSESVSVLDKADALQKFDAVYLSMYNAKTPVPSDAGKQNLLDFVNGGKGFVVTHLSSASFKDWAEFRKLCGRYWVMSQSGHGPRSKFNVTIVDAQNPIVKGLPNFEADDELYAKLQGDAPVQVLAQADSDWSKKTEPLVFTLDYGKGRVFHHTFGHDGKALAEPSIRKIIERGTEWAATGKVK